MGSCNWACENAMVQYVHVLGAATPNCAVSTMYFPTNQTSLSDSSFSQILHNHLASCPNVPQEIKDALVELKQLAVEHGVTTKRGTKKTFFEKIWERMNDERICNL